MRLSPSRWIAAGALALTTACAIGETTPPTVVEPAEGALVDRPLVRVRMSPPGRFDLGDEDSSGTRMGAHAAWRVNDGEKHDIAIGTVGHFDDAGTYLFAATLEPGDNELELGRCDAIDVCGWTPVAIRYEPRAGSPSVLALAPETPTEVWPDGEGRAVMLTPGAPATLTMLGPDGRPVRSFGDRGVLALPSHAVGGRAVYDASGASFVLLTSTPGQASIVRVTSEGAVDESWGTGGALAVGVTAEGSAAMHDVALASDGGLVVGGVLEDGRAIIQRLDAAGNERGLVVAPAVDGGRTRMARIDGDGRLVVATETALYRVDADGALDASFGDGGVVEIPASSFSRAIALSGDTVWLADHVRGDGASGTRLLEVAPDATRESLQPIVGLDVVPPVVAVDPSGAVLIAGRRATDETAEWPVRSDFVQTGTEIVIARVRGHELDATFGDAGIGHASLRLAHAPIPRDATSDDPLAMAVSADGAAYVVARSIAVVGGTITEPRYETAHGLARFVP